MAVSVGGAENYFATKVLYFDEWAEADPAVKQRALNAASAQLYRLYKNYDPTTKPLVDDAVYEQALWMLRADDTIRKAEQGVRSVSVSGVSIYVDRVNLMVAPQAALILGRRIGRTVIE
jgi:hypothetical protein